MSDLTVGYAGLSLPYPLVVETAGTTLETTVVQRISDAPSGAIIVPPFECGRAVDVPADPSYTSNNRSDTADRDTARIVRNLDTDAYVDMLERVCKASRVPVIAPIRCARRSQAIEVAEVVSDAGASAIEIRPILETNGKAYRSDAIEKQILKIAAAIADRVDLPVTIRVPVSTYGMTAFVDALGECGIRGVVLDPPSGITAINTDQVALDPDPGNAEVRVAALLATLAAVREIYRRVTPHLAVPIPTGRGRGSVEALLSGATVVHIPIDMADMQRALAAVSSHARTLQGWMGSRRFDSLFDFRGALSDSRLTSSLERRSRQE
jgi:hypothetical protein